MSFASYEFLFGFLPFALAVVLVAETLDRERLLLPALIAVSAVFYGWGSIPHLILLLGLIIVTWTVSQAYARSDGVIWRRALLAAGVLTNAASLTIWKYGNSLVESWNRLGIVDVAEPSIIMPLGISFYAFQQIGYLMDIRRGRAKLMTLIDYVAFVLFFPQLIAGPIVTERRMGREFAKARAGQPAETRLRLAYLGLAWFSIGLFKKTVVADGITTITTPLIAEAMVGPIPTADAWQVAIAPFTQIYFDFSGYSDMAVGLALLFGIRIPANFNAPYRAKSAREFWTRWHITFHQFVRDHIYGPLIRRLGGWRFGAALSLFLAIILSALWHGNSVQFMFWGVLLFLSIVATSFYTSFLPESLATPLRYLTIGALFLSMNILFTVPDLSAAGRVFVGMFSGQGTLDTQDLLGLSVVVVAFLLARQEISTQVLLEGGREHRERSFFGWRPPAFAPNAGWVVAISVTFLVALNYVGRSPAFIYFGI